MQLDLYYLLHLSPIQYIIVFAVCNFFLQYCPDLAISLLKTHNPWHRLAQLNCRAFVAYDARLAPHRAVLLFWSEFVANVGKVQS